MVHKIESSQSVMVEEAAKKVESQSGMNKELEVFIMPEMVDKTSDQSQGAMAEKVAKANGLLEKAIEMPPETHFIMVHGITSGGWCWFKIKSLMDKAGYKVTCPDLKSAGLDPTDPNSILTPEEYDAPLIELISNLPDRARELEVFIMPEMVDKTSDQSQGAMAEEVAKANGLLEKAIEMPPETHFIMVHGITSGGWCWFKIKSLMDKAGYKVTCLDLKSAGLDPTDPNSILTPEEYDAPLIELISNLPDRARIIVVGTSGGGLSLTHMIHKFPKKIYMAIFVGATMLRNGFLTEHDLKDGIPDLSQFDFGFEKGIDHSPTSAMVKKDIQQEMAFQLCSEEDWTLVDLLTKPGPIQALQHNAKFINGEGIDEVKRVYIKTIHDLLLKPEQQDSMIEKWPPFNVFVIESDHNPNLSTPLELFDLLVKAAKM